MSKLNRRPVAPRLIAFEGLNDFANASKWTWRTDTEHGYRCPNKGEFYLSGAEPMAYKARQNLTTEYWVVEPIAEFTLQQAWLPKGSKH